MLLIWTDNIIDDSTLIILKFLKCLAQQINILELFLKDHVTPKTEVMAA